MSKIAFIGVGNMGSPMAANLLRAGHQVTVFDLNLSLSEPLKKMGAEVAPDMVQAVSNRDCIITMLPAGQQVRAVYLGDDHKSTGILELVAQHTLLIDSSTIDPVTAREVASHAIKKGLDFVDAPVSGGVAGAKAGTLTFIVGGEKRAYEKAQQVLNHMGKNVFHAGQAGHGQMAKICNNLMLGILMSGTCEALNLGIDNGLDPKVLSDIMLQSSGRNWALELYNPCPGVMDTSPASNEYQPGFMSKLMVKDLGLGLEAAIHSHSSVPMGALARNLFSLHNTGGNDEMDFSSLFEFYRSENRSKQG